MNETNEQTPVSSQAMLVGITMGLPRQSKELKSEASKVETEANASQGTVRASMHYFKKKDGGKEVDGLKTLKTFQGAWKSALEHYARFPFAAGMKLLPAQLVAEFAAKNSEFQSQAAAIWTEWADNEYPLWLDSAPTRMGNLFDSEDFPSLIDCHERFKCEVTIVPVPESEQCSRIAALSPDVAKLMADSTEKAVSKAVEASNVQLWEQVLKPIEHIVATLTKDKTKIHDTLIGNIIDIVDLVPASNLSGDKKLAELAAKAKKVLGSVKPDDLRKSAEAKQDTLVAAQGLLSMFKPYQRKFAE